MQFQIQLAQGTRRIQARDGVLNPKSFNIGTESFSKVGNSLFLSLALSLGWYVRHTSRKTALLQVGDYFDGQALHGEIISGQSDCPCISSATSLPKPPN